jgi:uncharacterized protein with PIN domain
MPRLPHRLYWQGTHWQAMNREVDGILSFENNHQG